LDDLLDLTEGPSDKSLLDITPQDTLHPSLNNSVNLENPNVHSLENLRISDPQIAYAEEAPLEELHSHTPTSHSNDMLEEESSLPSPKLQLRNSHPPSTPWEESVEDTSLPSPEDLRLPSMDEASNPALYRQSPPPEDEYVDSAEEPPLPAHDSTIILSADEPSSMEESESYDSYEDPNTYPVKQLFVNSPPPSSQIDYSSPASPEVDEEEVEEQPSPPRPKSESKKVVQRQEYRTQERRSTGRIYTKPKREALFKKDFDVIEQEPMDDYFVDVHDLRHPVEEQDFHRPVDSKKRLRLLDSIISLGNYKHVTTNISQDDPTPINVNLPENRHAIKEILSVLGLGDPYANYRREDTPARRKQVAAVLVDVDKEWKRRSKIDRIVQRYKT
jgi:hypothetical protein